VSLAALGLDLGLSGARAAVVDETGDLLGCGRIAGKPWQHGPGLAERAPEEWYEETLAAGRMALDQAGRPAIAAIGIGALGPCPVLLDADLRALAPAPLFSLDRRAEATRQRLLASHDLGSDALGPDHALPKLIWWRERDPALIGRAKWVVDATGFLVARLTGRPVMDPITAEDYEAPGIAPPVPPAPRARADSIAGPLLPGAAERLGLAPGIPVAAGSYDSYVDIWGSGARKPGDGCIVLGSTLILGRVVAAPGQAPGLRCQPHIGEGRFLGGWTSAAGSLLDWSRAFIGAGSTDWDSLASLLPGAGGLLVLPYFAGERAPIWDPAARGAILGATLATTHEELARAMIDSVALSALDLATRLPSEGDAQVPWRLCGGGARNRALAQALADALGRPLALLAHAGEAIAPALLAFNAIGRPVAARVERTLAPAGTRHARFERLYAIYRGLYPALAGSMHELGRLADQKEDR
jgi:xylulokinase